MIIFGVFKLIVLFHAKFWISGHPVDFGRNAIATCFSTHHLGKDVGRHFLPIDADEFYAFNALRVCCPWGATIAHPRTDKTIAFAISSGAFVWPRCWVVVRCVVFAGTTKFPSTFGDNEKEVTTFAPLFGTTKTFAVPFVHFFSAPAQAPTFTPDGNAFLSLRVCPFDGGFGEKLEFRFFDVVLNGW